MPALLIPVLVWVLSSAVAKILLALGIGFATYTGLQSLISELISLFQSNMSGIPVQILQLMELAGFSQAFSILSSALLARAAIQSAKAFITATSIV